MNPHDAADHEWIRQRKLKRNSTKTGSAKGSFHFLLITIFSTEEPRPKPIGKSQSKFDVKQPS